MPRENPTRTPTGILTFLGGLVLLVIFAVLVVQWVRSTGSTDDVAGKRAAGRKSTREQLAAKQQEQIQGTAWSDKAKGVARIPISEAMTLTMAELKGKKVAKSTVKVDPPLPVLPPDPNSTEPPPLALPSAPLGALVSHFEPFAAVAPMPGQKPANSATAPLPDVPTPGAAPAPTPGQSPTSAPAQPAATPSVAPAPAAPMPPSGGNGSPAVVPATGSTPAATLPAGTAPPMNTNGAIPAAQAVPGSAAPAPPEIPSHSSKPAAESTPPQSPASTAPTPTIVSPSSNPGEPVAPSPVPATSASAPASSVSQAGTPEAAPAATPAPSPVAP